MFSNIVRLFGAQSHSAVTQATDAPCDESLLIRQDGGWAPAGFDADGNYVVLSYKTGRLVTLRPEQLTAKRLQAVFGAKFCKMAYSEPNSDLQADVFAPMSLEDDVRDSCDEAGMFDAGNVRGPGLHRVGDQLVVNFGDQVRAADGTAVYAGPTAEGAYVAGQGLGFSFDTPCASEEDVRSVVETIGSFGLTSRFEQIAVIGWFAMAVYGEVLDHRPILAVSAERGSGKTTLIELMGNLLGPQAIRRDGIPSLAQVIYDLEHRSAALLTDEVEARGSKKKAVEDFLEAMRIGFTSSGTGRIKRITGGKVRHFNAPAGVLVAGIGLPAFNPATESRTVRVRLEPLNEARTAGVPNPLLDSSQRLKTVELGARLRRLLLSRWAVMQTAVKAVRSRLVSAGHEARSADKFAPLLAGYIALTNEHAPNAEAMDMLMDSFAVPSASQSSVERDSEACLRVLLDRRIAVFRKISGEPSKTHARVRDVIGWVVHVPGADKLSLIKQLEHFGIRLMWREEWSGWKLAVCASAQHAGLRKLLQGTDWVLGGWKDVLARLPGALDSVQKVASVAQRVVLFDLPKELSDSPTEEDYELPVARFARESASSDEAMTSFRGEWIE
jgi:hypothetical protein